MECCCGKLRQKEYSSESDTSSTVRENAQSEIFHQRLEEETKEESKEQQIRQLKQCEEANKNFSNIITKNEQESDYDWPRASTSSVFDCDWEYFSNYVSSSLQ